MAIFNIISMPPRYYTTGAETSGTLRHIKVLIMADGTVLQTKLSILICNNGNSCPISKCLRRYISILLKEAAEIKFILKS